MSEAVPTYPPKAGRRWLSGTLRVLLGVFMLLVVVDLLVDLTGIAGVWVVRGPVSSNVGAVSATVTRALTVADNGLSRVNDQVQSARQTLAQVNDGAAKLGNRVLANSPVVTRLRQLVENTLSPRVDRARGTAAAIHDALVTVSGTLAVLNRIPGVTVPTLSNQLAQLPDFAQAAQSGVQDLRARLADIKAGLVAKARAAVNELTNRIDAALMRIQATVSKYRATVGRAQGRVATISSTILTLLTLLEVTLTLLFLIVAAGLLLLVFFCWLYVRHGRFPSLRISRETEGQ